jgi:hypothetical protein
MPRKVKKTIKTGVLIETDMILATPANPLLSATALLTPSTGWRSFKASAKALRTLQMVF